MNDLNILHAQNAALKSRVSDTSLVCDSPASAPDRKDIDAFELAMRGGEKDFPQPNNGSDTMSSTSERKENFFQANLAPDTTPSTLGRKDIDASEIGIKENGILQIGVSDAQPDRVPFAKRLEPHQLDMLEKERSVFNSLQQNSEHPGERIQVKVESYRVLLEDEDKTSSNTFGRNDTPDLENGHTQLATLFSMASTFNDVEAPAAVVAPQASLSEDDLNMLVERILVSAANDGTQEVRLILNERVLSGTEIILSRDHSGQLVVSLHCTDASTFQTLVASQFDLKHLLEARETSAVHVSVDIHQDGNDSERRSQGYFEYEPDQPRKRDNA